MKASGLAEEQSARVENDSYSKSPSAQQYRGALERKISTLQAKLPQAPAQPPAEKSREPQAYHHPQDTYAEQAPGRAQIDPRMAPTSQHHSELLQQRARAAQAAAPQGAVGRSQNAVAQSSAGVQQQQQMTQHQASTQQAHPSYAPQGPSRAIMQIPPSRDPHGNFALQQQQQQYAAAKNEMNMSAQQQGNQSSQQGAYRMPGAPPPGVTNYGHMQSQQQQPNNMGAAQQQANQQQANMANHQRQNAPAPAAAQAAAAAKRGAHNPNNMLPSNPGHPANHPGMTKLPPSGGVSHMPGATTAAGTAKYASNPSYGQPTHPGMYNTQQPPQPQQQTATRVGNIPHQGTQHGMVMSGAASTASLQQQHQPMHSNHVPQHAPPAAHHPQTQQHNQQQPPQQQPQQTGHPADAKNAATGANPTQIPITSQMLFDVWIMLNSKAQSDSQLQEPLKAIGLKYSPGAQLGILTPQERQILAGIFVRSKMHIQQKQQAMQNQQAQQAQQQQQQHAQQHAQQQTANAAPHRPQQPQNPPIMQDTRNLQDPKMYSTMAPGIPQNVRQPAMPGAGPAGHAQPMPSQITANQAAQAKMAPTMPAHYAAGGAGGTTNNAAAAHHPPNGSIPTAAQNNAMQQQRPTHPMPAATNPAVANSSSAAVAARATAPVSVAAASNASLANNVPASAVATATAVASAPTNATPNMPPLTPEEARNALASAVTKSKDINRMRTLALRIRESLSPTAPLPLPDLLPLLPETPWWERPKRRLAADNTRPAEAHLIESQIVSYKNAKLREGALPKSSGIPTALLLASSLVNEGDQMMQDMKEIRDEIAALSGGDQSFTSTLVQLDLTLLQPSKPHTTSFSSSNGLCRACSANATLKESQANGTGHANASASFESGPSSASSQMAVDSGSDSTHRNIFGCGTAHRSTHQHPSIKSSRHEQCCTPALLIDFRAPSSDIPLPAVLAPSFTALGCRFGRSFTPVLRTLQRKYCPSFTLSTSNNKWMSVSSPLPPTARSLHASRSAVTTPHPPTASVTSPPGVMPSNLPTPNPAAVSTPLGSETGSQKSGVVHNPTPSSSAAAHANAESLRSDRVYAAKKYVRIVLECWKAWIAAITAFEEELALPEFHDVQFEESIRRTAIVAMPQEHAALGVSESAERKHFSRTDDNVKIEIGIIFSLKSASNSTNTSTSSRSTTSTDTTDGKSNESFTLPNLFIVLPVDYPRTLIDTVGIETSDTNLKARLYSIIGQLNAPTVSEILNVWLRFGTSLSHPSPHASLNSSQESTKMDLSTYPSESYSKKSTRYLKNGFAHKATFGHSNALIRTSRPILVQRR